jgi:hypothetical protein
VPYTVNCNPAPLTFTIRPKFGWQFLLGIGWVSFIGYQIFFLGWSEVSSDNLFELVIFVTVSFGICMALIRRERIEIYSEQMVWRKTYFGITRSDAAPLDDVLGAEWNEGEQRGRQGKRPDYVEFYLPDRSVKACFGFSFDDFDRMREDIRTMYPQLVNRWGRAAVRSKDLTLLNLN